MAIRRQSVSESLDDPLFGYRGPVYNPDQCVHNDTGYRVVWTGPWLMGTVVGWQNHCVWVQVDGEPQPRLIAKPMLRALTPDEETQMRLAAELAQEAEDRLVLGETRKPGKRKHTVQTCPHCRRTLPLDTNHFTARNFDRNGNPAYFHHTCLDCRAAQEQARNTEENLDELRACRVCGKVIPVRDFPTMRRNAIRRDVYRYKLCNDCLNKRDRAYRKAERKKGHRVD